MWTDLDRRYLKMRFDRIDRALEQLGGTIMSTNEDLTAAIADLNTAADNIIAALGAAASSVTQEQLDAAVASISAVTGKLNDAVHAHGM